MFTKLHSFLVYTRCEKSVLILKLYTLCNGTNFNGHDTSWIM